MVTILITGLSGTGKSTVIRHLALLGYPTIETDEPGWCVPEHGDWSTDDSEWIWDVECMSAVLDHYAGGPLFVSGCRSNQGTFYDRFDQIVLLSAPLDVMMERIAARTTNPFGKSARERSMIGEQKETIEPMLRRSATLELDTSLWQVTDVVDVLMKLTTSIGDDGTSPSPRSRRS
jgi:RNase adaptor protein for sRNA GlmZ degradation